MRVRRTVLLVAVLVGAVIAHSSAEAEAAFPGRNGLIAFSQFQSGDAIYVVRPDGTRPKRIIAPSKISGAKFPSWEATGKRILIEDSGGVVIVAANGSVLRKVRLQDVLGLPSEEFPPHAPAWAPDSSRFAVQYAKPSVLGQQLYVISLQGKKPKRVASGVEGIFDLKPAWDPKDRWIAYRDTDPRGCRRIRAVKPNGTGLKTLFVSTKRISNRTGACKYSPEDFDISPDGRRLAFVGVTSVNDLAGVINHNVYVVSIGDKKPRQLTTTGDAGDVAWSPNGRLLAWTDVRTQRDDGLKTVDVATGRVRRILSGFVTDPSWQPAP